MQIPLLLSYRLRLSTSTVSDGKVPNKNSCLLSLPVEAFWCILSFLSNRAVCELQLVNKKCLKQSAKEFARQFKHLIIAHDDFGINKLEGVADKPAVAALVRKVTISRRMGRASSDGCKTLLATLKHSLQQFRNIETVETDTATNPFIEPSYYPIFSKPKKVLQYGRASYPSDISDDPIEK